MKIQDQVATPIQQQTLKQLGVAQESFFYADRNNNLYIKEGDKYLCLASGHIHDGTTVGDFFSAFTVAELGVMLPQTIELNKTQKASIKIVRFNAWTISYSRHSSGIDVCSKESHSEAEARAAMLIYLLENSHITASEVNARLQS